MSMFILSPFRPSSLEDFPVGKSLTICEKLWMNTIHYRNIIRSHLVTIAPMAPFTPKSTLKLRSALHSRYSIVIPCFISRAIRLNPKGFHNTFDYNHFTNSD